jgi:hypothetical protein
MVLRGFFKRKEPARFMKEVTMKQRFKVDFLIILNPFLWAKIGYLIY